MKIFDEASQGLFFNQHCSIQKGNFDTTTGKDAQMLLNKYGPSHPDCAAIIESHQSKYLESPAKRIRSP